MSVLLVIDLPDERVGAFPRQAKADHLHAWYASVTEAEMARFSLLTRFGERDHSIVITDHCPRCGAAKED